MTEAVFCCVYIYTPHLLYLSSIWQSVVSASPCSVLRVSLPDCWVALVRWHCWVAAADETSLHFLSWLHGEVPTPLVPPSPSRAPAGRLTSHWWEWAGSHLLVATCLGISIWTLPLFFCLQATGDPLKLVWQLCGHRGYPLLDPRHPLVLFPFIWVLASVVARQGELLSWTPASCSPSTEGTAL